jgi:hypothetical protein
MTTGYYFCLPSSEVKKILRHSVLIFVAIIIGLAIVTGRNFVDTAIFVALLHVGMYFFLLRYKYVYVSTQGVRGDSPLGSSKMFSWSDDIEICRSNSNGIHGYAIRGKGLLDTIFVPRAIFDSPQFRSAVSEFAPPSHALLAHVAVP